MRPEEKLISWTSKILSAWFIQSVCTTRCQRLKVTDPKSLTFFNLIHQRTALFCPVSRSMCLLPHQTEDCSLKHTHKITKKQIENKYYNMPERCVIPINCMFNIKQTTTANVCKYVCKVHPVCLLWCCVVGVVSLCKCFKKACF